MCPLCEQHPLELVIKTEHQRAPYDSNFHGHITKVVGAEGRCAACGFVAAREVEHALYGAQVMTVLHVCPDEPNPLLLTAFEEHADSFLMKPPFTAPVVTIDTLKFEAALQALTNAAQKSMDEMILNSFGGRHGKTNIPEPYTVTLEFFEQHYRGLGLTHEDVWELDRMGLLECSGRQNTITFQPLTPMFDGSLRAIAGEFKLRKQHLDEWKKRQP